MSVQEEIIVEINEENVFFEQRNSAFKKRLESFAIVNKTLICPKKFLQESFIYFEREIVKKLQTQYRLKVNTSFKANYEKKNDQLNESMPLYVQTINKLIQRETDLSKWYEKNVEVVILKKIEDFEENGSGWVLKEVIELCVNINDCELFTGSTYVPTPDFLEHKRAIINVQNNDNMCFKWAVLSALYPTRSNAHRVSKYKPFENNVNFTGIEFPVDLKQISKFEKQNNNILINVYEYNKKFNCEKGFMEKKIVPIRLTKKVKSEPNQTVIHLLLLREEIKNPNPFHNPITQYYQDIIEGFDTSTVEDIVENCLNEKNVDTGHYCWIRSFSRLMSSFCSRNEHKIFICDRCLCYFTNQEKLDAHMVDCFNFNKCKVTVPNDSNKWISFTNIQRQLEIPFIIYADTESILTSLNDDDDDNLHECKTIPKGAYQRHEPYSIGYYLYCRFDNTKSFYKSCSGETCIQWFADELYEIANEIVGPILRKTEKMKISDDEENKFQEATECSICCKKIYEDEIKVRDHSHITGNFRGAAHNNCNLLYKESTIIPVVFHNLDYDMHFLIETMANRFKGKIDILPVNKDHYISFVKHVDSDVNSICYKDAIKLKFIDSFKFMSTSLEKLASYLSKEDFHIAKKEFQEFSDEKINLLTRKGVFPYDYIDSWEKLKEVTLPSKDMFYSKLYENTISDEQYTFAKHIWNTFKTRSILDYAELYLKTDIILLADVFENFRSTCLNLYGLDPAHYYTLPGLSWDAMLKHTKVRIETLTDVDQLLFVEKGRNRKNTHKIK